VKRSTRQRPLTFGEQALQGFAEDHAIFDRQLELFQLMLN